ncbi:DUF917-domain-containing protein [Marasmius fiardii PR-910]|nr:DUF917-domain-containing protein [Marasmius fiardii PR-910]
MRPSNSFRIGVDVGGTNTDAVLLDPFTTTSENRGILSWHKLPTTANPSHGIENVITTLIKNANVDVKSVASVTIGTTHFINAVIEKDRSRLAPVAVLRLCGPFSRSVPPGVDWPTDLRSIICAYCGYLDGGLEIDGQIIRDIKEDQVREECERVKAAGVKVIVVNGIFAPADVMGEMQEERVKEWILKFYPEAEVVLSKEVANLGFIERENAAILNASILTFARDTIASFQTAIHRRLGLSCPVFLTQNDGTILQATDAARLPIRTFNSGPTNSMCGAAFLVKQNAVIFPKQESIIVVDIGGTTTDVGMLLPSGLPRQAAAVTEIAGVRMNFSCPDVKSIGLGGGSIVRLSQDVSGSEKQKITIGPDSVGHDIITRALVFEGDVHTATDYSVVSQASRSSSSQLIGEKDLAITAIEARAKQHDISTDSLIDEYETVLRKTLEGIIDRMKTSAEDIPVLLVGGGAVLVSEDGNGKIGLAGASKVIKPRFSGVANAIGAAIARVSGTVDRVVLTEGKSTRDVLEGISKISIDRAVESGAVRDTVQIAEMDAIPIQYVANKTRVLIKAIGDFDFSRVPLVTVQEELFKESATAQELGYIKNPLEKEETTTTLSAIEISSYKPKVVASSRLNQYEWIISELDLEWISCGCYILGTGGGGTPYPHFVRLREMMRKGAEVRVVEPGWLRDDDVVACGGGKGSPTVSVEKLAGDEMIESQNTVYKYLGIKPVAVIDLEIGGGNGLQGLILGASTNMNVPTIDGDWMGRAYPVSWQITPVVWGGDGALFVPSAISDGNGNNMLMLTGTSEKMIERAFRAALSEMGSHVACAKGPTTGERVKSWAVENTISLSWRIGRAVALCRAKNDIDFVSEAIIDQVGGKQAAKVLFKGKIIGVERKTVKGHVYGEVTIKAADVSGSGSGAGDVVEGDLMKIPFKNENIVATRVTTDGKEEVVATVPDLISVCDASSGEAIGTPEYRYGLLVFVLGIQASEKWTGTPRGIEIGGPGAFGMDHVKYKPLGTFTKPRTVIDEFKR